MSIEIQLDDKWWITKDAHNWMLSTLKKRKGKTSLEGEKFFPSIQSLLKYYIKMEVPNTNYPITSLHELVELENGRLLNLADIAEKVERACILSGNALKLKKGSQDGVE